MEQQQHDMNVAIAALKGAATGIASAMEDESISSEEVYCLLSTLADSLASKVKAAFAQHNKVSSH